MVSEQNLKLIAPHLLSRTHLCLDGCWRSQDPRRSFKPRLGLAPIHIIGLGPGSYVAWMIKNRRYWITSMTVCTLRGYGYEHSLN